jgi:hypothetical protein
LSSETAISQKRNVVFKDEKLWINELKWNSEDALNWGSLEVF